MTTIYLLSTVLCFVIGGLLGKIYARRSIKQQLVAVFEEGRLSGLDEAEASKVSLSRSLNEELFKIRDGILQSAEAYDSAVRTVEKLLVTPTEATRPALSAPETFSSGQLQLGFDTKPGTDEIKPAAGKVEEKLEKVAAGTASPEVKVQEIGVSGDKSKSAKSGRVVPFPVEKANLNELKSSESELLKTSAVNIGKPKIN